VNGGNTGFSPKNVRKMRLIKMNPIDPSSIGQAFFVFGLRRISFI
jgi:hypothetical protein